MTLDSCWRFFLVMISYCSSVSEGKYLSDVRKGGLVSGLRIKGIVNPVDSESRENARGGDVEVTLSIVGNKKKTIFMID